MDTDLQRSALVPPKMTGLSGGPAQLAAKGSAIDLKHRISTAAFAFRGYDVANLGRSLELLEHENFGPVVHAALTHASELCSEAIKAKVDLIEHVREGAKTSVDTFPQDVATIVAMEAVQLELLEEFFHVPIHDVKVSFGYSIGELTALIFSGVFTLDQLLPVPLQLAPDCATLAHDTTLGVLFTKGGNHALHHEDVERLCRAVSSEGKGLIGPSAYLSPNTALLLGQGDTLDRLERRMHEFLPPKVMLRRNPNKWPPLHSPLVWECLIPNRAAVSLYHIEGSAKAPVPPIVSSVTGDTSYDGVNTRDILIKWTDHPQRLWDVIDTTLSIGVETVIHVGPAPSLIAATFARLSNNVSRQLGNGNKYLHMLGRGLVTEMNRHAWLSRLLPSRTALLRAPYLLHVHLEDWLLEQKIPRKTLVAIPAPNGEACREESPRLAAADGV